MLRLSYIWLAWLVDASLKSLLLGVVIGAAMAVLRVRNTNVRHRAWTAVLLGMLVLPGLVLVVPRVPLPTQFLPRLTLREGQSSGTRSTTDAASPGETDETPEAVCQPKPAPLVVSVKTSPLAGDGTYHAGPGELSEVVRAESPRAEDIGQGAVQRALRPGAVPGEPHGAEGALSSWPLTVVATYASVFAAFAVRLLVGILGAARLVCRARRVPASCVGRSFDGQAGPAALEQDPCEGVAEPLGRISILESPSIRLPLTVGCLRPKVLLPMQWRTWTATRLRRVLAHELAHIHRGDYLVTFLAELNLCLYWFHPLAWYLRKCLARLAEHCCDDAVIASSGERTQYARDLLEVASSLVGHRGRLMHPAAIPMAHGANVERRVAAILDAKRPLSRRLGWLTSGIVIGLFVPVVLVVAGLRLASEEAAAAAYEALRARVEPGPESSGPPHAEEKPKGETDSQAGADAGTGTQEAVEQSAFRVFDGFDGKLERDWKVVRPDPTHVSLTKHPGRLTITSQYGGLHPNEGRKRPGPLGRNVHLISNPAMGGGDFVVTTCIERFHPELPYQQAGPHIYDDDDNYLKAAIARGPFGVMISSTWETMGEFGGMPVDVTKIEWDRVWLRITKRGRAYESAYSLDGKEYTVITERLG